MKKFWGWMKEKGHIGTERWLRPECADKQMLIGYMMEYLIENRPNFKALYFSTIGIQGIYEFLISLIEELVEE